MLYTVAAVVGSSIALLVYIAKRSMNRVLGFGPFYIIRRDNGTTGMPHLALGFMKELGYPWRRGKGLQLRIKTQIIQIGLCRKTRQDNEETGILDAVQGRYLSDTAGDIGNWK
jgi:hypothetical protein